MIPNLLLPLRSVLVIDPKGENARITGQARAEIGPVYVLDPFGLTGFSRHRQGRGAAAGRLRSFGDGRPPAPAARSGSRRRQNARRGPRLFLLDEFAALGRLEAVERAMGLMAG